VISAPPSTPEEACHAEAWQHRLDVLGDERLSYGQAYRRCMEQQAGNTRPVVATPEQAAPAVQVRRPAKASRG